MRDIHSGRDINVGGDFVVNDGSHQPKFLSLCSVEELLAEEPLRRQRLSEERKAKFNRFLTFVVIAASLLFIAGVWGWFQGQTDLFSLAVGGAGFMVGAASLKIYDRPTVFEQRQLEALKEIHMLLRERGVR
ncbi:MAG: hypothetical protein ACN6PE_23130 [Achromobacter marplatensis]|uniref:hypothetical protein n=1 Tax=Achromobacter marplatensis TaxID=470868 RepID=UPI003D08C543